MMKSVLNFFDFTGKGLKGIRRINFWLLTQKNYQMAGKNLKLFPVSYHFEDINQIVVVVNIAMCEYKLFKKKSVAKNKN